MKNEKKWVKPTVKTLTEEELSRVILASACSSNGCTALKFR